MFAISSARQQIQPQPPRSTAPAAKAADGPTPETQPSGNSFEDLLQQHAAGPDRSETGSESSSQPPSGDAKQPALLTRDQSTPPGAANNAPGLSNAGELDDLEAWLLAQAGKGITPVPPAQPEETATPDTEASGGTGLPLGEGAGTPRKEKKPASLPSDLFPQFFSPLGLLVSGPLKGAADFSPEGGDAGSSNKGSGGAQEPPVDLLLSTPQESTGSKNQEPLLAAHPPSKTEDLLREFEVRRFEFKTEIETPPTAPGAIQLHVAASVADSTKEEAGTGKSKESAYKVDGPVSSGVALDHQPDSVARAAAPEAVERVRVVIEPPPPPPVARQVSIQIGEADSQVNIVIRERNGDLAVQFGAATERLRDNLQNAAPFLMHQLQRDAMQTVRLDFSNFGSATDAGKNPNQDRHSKKFLKSEAEFAGLEEMTDLSAPAVSVNRL